MGVDSPRAEEARVGMHARILRCPLGGNPDDCPLHKVREWPLEERLAWLESKSDEEVIELYRRHTDCLEFKLAWESS
jgi:hypothetical protein